MLCANFLFLFLYFCFPVAAAPSDNNNDGLKVADDFFAYTGQREGDVKAWRGIQYARPPTQSEGLRFRMPQDPKRKPEETFDKDACNNKPICLTSGEARSPDHDEDCLYLNVYAPASATMTSKLPVMIWISGGGMQGVNDGYRDLKDFVKAAGNDIIAVSFSYRVGIFGFLASTELEKEKNLNFGLHDQRKAIEWVNRFIDRWGGDPDRVTIMGGSAGGGSVTYHLLGADTPDMQNNRRRSAKHRSRANALQPKFAGAIAQSPSSPQILTVDQSHKQWNTVVQLSKCTGDILNCLRTQRSQDEILQYSSRIPYDGRSHKPIYMWNPVVDGSIVPDIPFKLFSKGSIHKVPTIFGSDSFDGMTFPPPAETPVTDDSSMNSFLLDNFPRLLDQQLHDLDSKPELQYPWKPDANEHAERLYGDIRYQCSAVFYAASLAKSQNQNNNNNANAPVWAYQYNVGEDYKVGHMAETGAILGAAISDNPGTAVMQRHWFNFIKHQKPADGWSAFDPDQPQRMVFSNGGAAMTDLDKGKDTNQEARCQYLAGIGAQILQ